MTIERGIDMEAICKEDFDRRVKSHKDAEKVLEQAKKEGKSTSKINVPEIGFHEIYGVWFFGRIKENICQISKERFGVDTTKMMHVFVDVEPKKISEGIYDVTVYGYPCRLYKWMAQGYYRGLLVLKDDEAGNSDADVYRQSGTWSWILKNEDKI